MKLKLNTKVVVETDDDYYLDNIRNTKFLKDNTKTIYLNKINKIITEVYPNWKLHDIITKPETFMDRFNKYSLIANKGKPIGDHNKETYASSILAIFTYNSQLKEKYFDQFQQWNKIHEQIRQPIETKYKSNIPTQRQQKAYIDFQELIEIRDSLPIGSIPRLLLAMYTYIPPVRSDYYRTKIYFETPKDNKYEEDNVIILDDKTKRYILVLEKYKTAKVYGVKVIDLPIELVNEIKQSLKLFPREYLFISQGTGQKFDLEASFNNWANRCLKRTLNKPTFTISMLRHIFITRRDLKLEEKSGLEQNEIANIMGHSVEQQRKYMWHTWIKEVHSNMS